MCIIFLLLILLTETIYSESIITKLEVSKNIVYPGDVVIYTFTCENTSTIVELIEAELKFSTYSLFEYLEPTKFYQKFELLPETSKTFHITSKIKKPLDKNLTNTIISCDLYINNKKDKSLDIKLLLPKLNITFENSPKGTITSGAKIQYKIIYANEDTQDINSGKFLLLLSNTLKPITYPGGIYEEKNNTITYDVGKISSFTTQTISLECKVISNELTEEKTTIQTFCWFSSERISLFLAGSACNTCIGWVNFSDSAILPSKEYVKPNDTLDIFIRLKNTGNIKAKSVIVEVKDIKGLEDIKVKSLQSLAEVIPGGEILDITSGFFQFSNLKPGRIRIKLERMNDYYESKTIPTSYSTINELINEINTSKELQDFFYIKYDPASDKFIIQLKEGYNLQCLEETGNYGFFSCINLPSYNKEKNIIRYNLQNLAPCQEEIIKFKSKVKDGDGYYSFNVGIGTITEVPSLALFEFKRKIDRFSPNPVKFIYEIALTSLEEDLDFDIDGNYGLIFGEATDIDDMGIAYYKIYETKDLITWQEIAKVATPTKILLKGREKGYIYFYKVKAYDYVGNSSESVSDGIAIVDYFHKIHPEKDYTIKYEKVEIEISRGSFAKPVYLTITCLDLDKLNKEYQDKLKNKVSKIIGDKFFVIKAYFNKERPGDNFLIQKPKRLVKLSLPYFSSDKEKYYRIYVWDDNRKDFKDLIYQTVDTKKHKISGYTDILTFFVICLPKKEPEGFKVYPNPFYLEKNHEYIKFENIGQGTEIWIYNIAGDLIKHEKHQAGSYIWQVLEEDVASGLYLYFLKSDNFQKKGKILVIK
jgi:hypothetical protein